MRTTKRTTTLWLTLALLATAAVPAAWAVNPGTQVASIEQLERHLVRQNLKIEMRTALEPIRTEAAALAAAAQAEGTESPNGASFLAGEKALEAELDRMLDRVFELKAAHAELLTLIASGDRKAITRVGGAFHTGIEGLEQEMVDSGLSDYVIELVRETIEREE